jgi:predicted dehydrogenase
MPYVDAPRFIESDRLAPFNPRGSDVAVVLDLMIHDIDLVCTLVGDGERCEGHGHPGAHAAARHRQRALEFANGAVANVTASRVSRERVRKLRLFQRSGICRSIWPPVPASSSACVAISIRRCWPRSRVHSRSSSSVSRSTRRRRAAAARALAVSRRDRGARPVAVTGEDGREALAVALRIMREIERTLPSVRRGPRAGVRCVSAVRRRGGVRRPARGQGGGVRSGPPIPSVRWLAQAASACGRLV